jgi:hypothetical protein
VSPSGGKFVTRDRLGINVDPNDFLGAWKPLQDQWTQNLRWEVAAFALSDESPEVRDVGRRLGVAVSNSLSSSAWFLRDLVRPTQGGDLNKSREVAKQDHAEAVQLARELMALIRGEGGNRVATRQAETSRDEMSATRPESE